MDKHHHPNPNQPPVDETRRRLAKAGLAAPAVLGVLASRPVLADAWNCTISGQISGNVSRPGKVDCATLGRSPGYWKTHESWPSPCVWGAPVSGECPTTTTTGTRFNGFTHNGATLADAFKCKDGKVYDPSQDGWETTSEKATMLQVLRTGGGLNDTNIAALGRATVASLLNALQFAPNYPLSPQQVIAMFNAVYNGGTYYINPTTSWDRDQVKSYFESLY